MNYLDITSSYKNSSLNCIDVVKNNYHHHMKSPNLCSLSTLSFNKKNASPINSKKILNNFHSNENSNFSNKENNLTISAIINPLQSNKKITKRNFNSIFNKYDKKNPNTFNYFKISKTIDEDISINENKTIENEKYFEKIEKEFELRNLKQKLNKLKKNNVLLKEKVAKLTKINDSTENDINFQHNKKIMIVCELINIYYQGVDKKNINKKLNFKELLFSLMDLKIEYENKKLIDEFFNGATQMITFSKIFNNSKNMNNIKNPDIFINYFAQLLQIINEHKNNSNNCDAELIEKINQCKNTVNYCDYYKEILKTTLNNGKNALSNKILRINENDDEQFGNFDYKVCITDNNNLYNKYNYSSNYNNKNNKKDNKKLFFKKYFHYVKNPINDVYSLEINNNSLSTGKNKVPINNNFDNKIKKKRILWNLKLKNNRKLNDNNENQVLNLSPAKVFPSFSNRNNKKLKYHFLNDNNNSSYYKKIEGVQGSKNNYSQRSNGKKTQNYIKIKTKKIENSRNENSKKDIKIRNIAKNLTKKNQSYINSKI